MSGLIRWIAGVGSTPQNVAGVPLQSSIYGLPLPLVYGTAKVAGNVIQMPNPPSVQNWSQVDKKGNPKKATTAVAIAICEGSIIGVVGVWADKDRDTWGRYQKNGWHLETGLVAPTSWSTPPAGQQVPYQYVAYARHDSAEYTNGHLKNYAWEVQGFLPLTAAPTLSSATPSTTGGSLASATYDYVVTAIGAQGESVVSNGFTVTTTGSTSSVALVWTSVPGATAYKVYRTPGGGAQVYSNVGNVTTYTDTGAAFTSGSPPATSVKDANPSAIITDILTDPNHGFGWTPYGSAGSWIADWTTFSQYCLAAGIWISPVIDTLRPAADWIAEFLELANTAAVWSDGKLKMIPFGDTSLSANGATYTPNTTPLYDLTDTDFLAAPGEDPITVTRKAAVDRFNQLFVEYESRYAKDTSGNTVTAYIPNTVQADDLLAVQAVAAACGDNGLRPAPKKTYRSIRDEQVARNVAQLLLQREQYVANAYTFRLGWRYSLLEPMDLVTLTDVGLGLNKTPVRIVDVTEIEDEQGIEITAEDWPFGVASATAYPATPGGGWQTSTAVAPGSTTAPVIFDGPRPMETSPFEVWIAATGGQYWGGCEVWYSFDNVTYYQWGRLTGKSNFGVLAATLPSGTVWPGTDGVNSLQVDLTTSQGSLVGFSATDFAALASLCYVDGEYVAFQNETLTAQYKYTLSTLYRALYGSSVASHAIGATFVRCDNAIAKVALPQVTKGQTVYFKFPAFNLYGQQLEDISTVTAYTHVIGAAPGQPQLQVTVARDGTTNPGLPGYNVTVTNLASAGAGGTAAVTLAVTQSGQGSVSPSSNQSFNLQPGASSTINYQVTQPTPGQQPCVVTWTATAPSFATSAVSASIADMGQDPAQMCALDINQDGSADASVSLANVHTYFKYAYLIGNTDPTDAQIAAGTQVNQRIATLLGFIGAGGVLIGQTVRFGVIPYTANNVAGPSIRVHATRRDTVGLQIKVVKASQTGNQITFTVSAIDPYPQGANSVTVTAAAVDCTVSPASATITPTASFGTTGTASFTVTMGSNPGRVTLDATASNRTDAVDAIDIPSGSSGDGGGQYPPVVFKTAWISNVDYTNNRITISFTYDGQLSTGDYFELVRCYNHGSTVDLSSPADSNAGSGSPIIDTGIGGLSPTCTLTSGTGLNVAFAYQVQQRNAATTARAASVWVYSSSLKSST